MGVELEFIIMVTLLYILKELGEIPAETHCISATEYSHLGSGGS